MGGSSLRKSGTKGVCALLALLCAFPASAVLYESPIPVSVQSFPEVTFSAGNIDLYPEVVVFPIQIAEGESSIQKRHLNKMAQLADGGIAIIYPEIGEPYRSVFTQIIEGIEEKAKGRVSNYPVKPDVNISELRDSLKRQETRVVIALGRQGMKVASALNDGMGVVVGGVLSSVDEDARNLQINTLTPDPGLLFARLKEMQPQARRILTVYDPRQNEWLIELAKTAARAQGMELVAYRASDLRTAMRYYQEILASADGRQDALWLPQDSTTVEEGTVMPLVLQESWSRGLPVFSSNFSHVKRGVLFSLYPDNVGLGRHLAKDALSLLGGEGGKPGSVVPLREVLMAVNLRTAKHLGLNSSQGQNFNMVFPEQ